MNICIGIDLGTTYSAVAYWNNDHCEIIPNKEGKNITPSWVCFSNEEILVGDNAKLKAPLYIENTIFDIKRIIGKRFNDENLQEIILNSNYPFNIMGDSNNSPYIKINYKNDELKLKPEQISAMILSYLKEIAEEKIGCAISKAVITVPAYFNNSQREATKQAAVIAGIDCIRIINEPTAACLCYGIDKKYERANILVFDLGGGTFDVSILNVENAFFTVCATSGNPHLGGEDFDNKIVEYLIDDYKKIFGIEMNKTKKNLRKLKNIAEKAKCSLSTSLNYLIEFTIDGNEYIKELKRSVFEKICMDLFEKCLEPVLFALKDSKLNKTDIDEIILVGGSTRIPKIRELLSQLFLGKTLNLSVHPDEAVAIGAAIQGAILVKSDNSEKTKDILLLDVIPLSLGIESKGGVMSKIIMKNTQIPCKFKKMYSTSEDKQTSVEIKIFEGEREFVKDNHKIGDFELANLPKQPRGVPKIEILFDVDNNGILKVYATEINSGTNATIIINNDTKLTQEEINKMIEDADKYRTEDELRKFAMNSKNNYEKYLNEILRIINTRELITDEKGEELFEENELICINKSILSNLEWLENDDEYYLTKEIIDNTRSQFEHSIKGSLNKIYLRKQQLELKNTYIKEEEEINPENIADILDQE